MSIPNDGAIPKRTQKVILLHASMNGKEVSASSARKMGCYLLTETMGDRHQLSMSSYDRFFPNQDTMPKGGFGNLIALPFQNEPRQKGNSLFVNEQWIPFLDQWAFLSSIRRIPQFEVDLLVKEAQKKGQIIGVPMGEPVDDEYLETPWKRPPSRRKPKIDITGPLPQKVQGVLSQLLYLEIAALPSPLINQIKRLAAFQNPEFYKKQAMRLSTALSPRVISCSEEHIHHIGIPRGCIDDLRDLLSGLNITLEIEDQRTIGSELDLFFHGQLSSIQNEAVESILAHDIGVFVAPPGSGKTVVGANLITCRRRSTLVLVHRTQLLEQWITQLSIFLDLKPKEIGQIGAGKRKPNGNLDVAMIQSLVRKDNVDDIVVNYGHIIVDECHHVPAVSFERIMCEVKARFITGLTATPNRRDGHHPILQFQLGPKRFIINDNQTNARPFDHKLILQNTDFSLPKESTDKNIQEIYSLISSDETRNQLILGDVISALENGRSPILLTERRDHLEYFATKLKHLVPNLIILQGGMKKKDRQSAIEKLTSTHQTEERLVLATGRFIGEGFDDARLDTLFLAMPVSWKGTLIQYVGRLHRKFQAKTEVQVIDYVDRNVPMLIKMFKKRMKGYRAMGYSICDNANSSMEQNEYTIEYDEDVLMDLNDAHYHSEQQTW